MPRTNIIENERDPLSSLNDYFICNTCQKQYLRKGSLQKHIKQCERTRELELKRVTCRWCNVVFKNAANLATHAQKLHNDTCYSRDPIQKQQKCDICNIPFNHLIEVRYHIRKHHFNLKSKAPYCNQKKVNQVWFERVHNSNNVMEIKKTGPNTLVMRKLDDNTAIKVIDQDTEEIDVTHVYPTAYRNSTAKCKICAKKYIKRNLKKHMEEVHFNKMKYHCNNCNFSFKRLYQFLKHVCQKQRRRRQPRGVKQVSKDIIISSIGSLAAGQNTNNLWPR